IKEEGEDGETTERKVVGDFSEDALKYVKLAFEASPNKLLVRTYDGESVTISDVLKDLVLERFHYYAAPNAEADEIKTILSWHKDIVKKRDKTCKFIAFEEVADEETIINWTVPRVVYEDVEYTGQEFTTLIASELAALPLT